MPEHSEVRRQSQSACWCDICQDAHRKRQETLCARGMRFATELIQQDQDWGIALDSACERADRLEAALERIETWSRAYPLDVFPEPDLKRCAEVLKAAGLTLDAISASNMRHVVEGVGKIATEAISQEDA